MIVANDVGKEGPSAESRGFESRDNEVYIIDKEKHVTHLKHSKRYVASKILDLALENYKTRS
jgi:phosphopantothenoylcysteine synthetase/decarboxylase